MIEGLQKSPVGSPPKLRLNSVLNSMTRRGPFLGNSAGVLAMVYNGINSTIGYYRGKHDAGNSLVAGALSGMLFKSTRGVRSMAISGGLVAGVAGLWAVSSSTFIFQGILLTEFDVGHEEDAVFVNVLLSTHAASLRHFLTSAFLCWFSGYCIDLDS